MYNKLLQHLININPLVRDPLYLVGMAKMLIKKKRSSKYECHVYESVGAYLRLYLKKKKIKNKKTESKTRH